jgi:hypothetical protein
MDGHDTFGLRDYEIPNWLVRPAVEACRFFNGAVDGIFYNTPGLTQALTRRDQVVATMQGSKLPSRITDFNALRDPEGSLLLIDPATEPYVHRFENVKAFLQSPHEATQTVEIVTITGVGSSALGSAAFAWDVAAAVGKPVLAIVPGYGVADLFEQALGGWFRFGLRNWLHSKQTLQDTLAKFAPKAAAIGRNLSASTPNAKSSNGAPVFRYGSGSSDVLHDLMEHRTMPFHLLVGHSKGALQIGNAISSLPAAKTTNLDLVTMGCPIAEDVPGVNYHQFLGILDALGLLNMWGNWPEHWTWSWHTTNPMLPPAMNVRDAIRSDGGNDLRNPA